MAGADPNAGGLAQSLRRLLMTVLSITQNRLELAAVELSEEKCRFLQTLFLGAIFFFLAMLALLMVTATVVVVFWDQAGLILLVAFSILYALGALTAFLSMRAKIKNWPQTFAHTVAEIKKDCACLRAKP